MKLNNLLRPHLIEYVVAFLVIVIVLVTQTSMHILIQIALFWILIRIVQPPIVYLLYKKPITYRLPLMLDVINSRNAQINQRQKGENTKETQIPEMIREWYSQICFTLSHKLKVICSILQHNHVSNQYTNYQYKCNSKRPFSIFTHFTRIIKRLKRGSQP